MIKARFTLTYHLIVMTLFAGLVGAAWYLLVIEGAGSALTFEQGRFVLTVTVGAVKLAALSALAVAVLATELWDVLSPKDIVTLTPQGMHDRRLTRGPIPWSHINHIRLYRKGWQLMARLETEAFTHAPRDMGLGPMPLYALNRLCARWLNRPELNVGLGGLSVPTNDLVACLRQYHKGAIDLEPAAAIGIDLS